MEGKIEEFLGYLQKKRKLSEETITTYRSDLTDLASFLQQEGMIEHSAEWSKAGHQTLLDFTSTLQNQGYAPGTIARRVAACNSLIWHLVADRVLTEAGISEIDAASAKTLELRILSREEVEQLLHHIGEQATLEAKRDKVIVKLLYASGMRVSEVTCLNIGDVALDKKDEAYVHYRGSKRRNRKLSIEPEVAQALKEYTEEIRPKLLRDSGEQALFLNYRGRRLTRQGFWLTLKGYAKVSGISKKVSPHTLRHSNAVHMLQQGMDIQTLQQRLGHAQISTTKVYARLVS